MSEDTSATFDEALRLVLAFYCIMEPEKRAIIMALVEKYADHSKLSEALVEAANELTVAATKPTAFAQVGVRQATALIRQRDYVDHIRNTSFSIIENAIQQLGTSEDRG